MLQTCLSAETLFHLCICGVYWGNTAAVHLFILPPILKSNSGLNYVCNPIKRSLCLHSFTRFETFFLHEHINLPLAIFIHFHEPDGHTARREVTSLTVAIILRNRSLLTALSFPWMGLSFKKKWIISTKQPFSISLTPCGAFCLGIPSWVLTGWKKQVHVSEEIVKFFGIQDGNLFCLKWSW